MALKITLKPDEKMIVGGASAAIQKFAAGL